MTPCAKCGQPHVPRKGPRGLIRRCDRCRHEYREPDEGPDVPLDGLSEVERHALRRQRVLRAYADGVRGTELIERFGDGADLLALRALSVQRRCAS